MLFISDFIEYLDDDILIFKIFYIILNIIHIQLIY